MNARENIRQALEDCRTGTLQLFDNMEREVFCQQIHPEFSPLGWHLGHIAYTEALWILQRTAGYGPVFPQYHQLFAADGLPKHKRQELPSYGEICDYLNIVRSKVFDYLETATLKAQQRLWWFLIQHECQHCETISLLNFLCRWQTKKPSPPVFKNLVVEEKLPPLGEMIKIPAGKFDMGSDAISALDNERPKHSVFLDSYWIDCYPVTCGEYRQFIEAGGYQNCQFWSKEGWQWREQNSITKPLYWLDDYDRYLEPVCGVSWYEADAYARFVDKRLPTEAEWEKACGWDAKNQQSRLYPWGENAPNSHLTNLAFLGTESTGSFTKVGEFPAGKSSYGCVDMIGNVWEWTASDFTGYEEGFQPFPYLGYSQAYFDGCHRVLKGGSWATRPLAIRSSFRNWYQPQVRQILAGFRCAKND